MHISTDDLECPYCSSFDVAPLNLAIDLYRCDECGEHFEEQDDYRPQRAVKQRKMRHHKYREED